MAFPQPKVDLQLTVASLAEPSPAQVEAGQRDGGSPQQLQFKNTGNADLAYLVSAPQQRLCKDESESEIRRKIEADLARELSRAAANNQPLRGLHFVVDASAEMGCTLVVNAEKGENGWRYRFIKAQPITSSGPLGGLPLLHNTGQSDWIPFDPPTKKQ